MPQAIPEKYDLVWLDLIWFDLIWFHRSEVEDQKSALQRMEEAAARGESAQRSMEAQQRLLCEAEAKTGWSPDI